MAGVLIQRQGRTQGEGNDMTVETEIAVIHLQAKEYNHQKLEKTGKDSLPPVPEGAWP